MGRTTREASPPLLGAPERRVRGLPSPAGRPPRALGSLRRHEPGWSSLLGPGAARGLARRAPRAHVLGALAAVGVALFAASCGSTTSSVVAESTVEYIELGPAQRGAATTPPATRQGAPPSWSASVVERCRELEPLIHEVATAQGVEPSLVVGIVHVESKFKARAVSRAGARGLMQVMPSVGRRLGCGDLFDPRRNIACGAEVLKRFLARYQERLVFGLSAYNAGYRVPNAAIEANTQPANYRYVEKVLAARDAYLAHGCGS